MDVDVDAAAQFQLVQSCLVAPSHAVTQFPLFFAMTRLHIITDAIVALAFALFTSASVRSAVAASLVVPQTQASTAERFCF